MESENNNPKKPDQNVHKISLSADADYQKLIDLYQHADFENCAELLTALEKKFPGHPKLLKFKDDLNMQLYLKTVAATTQKEHAKEKRKGNIRKSVFAIISGVVVIAAFIVSYYFVNNAAIARRLEAENEQLTALQTQGEQLLQAGRPQPAAEIVERMLAINPEFEGLDEFKSQTDAMLQMEADYQTALGLAAEKKNEEALAILEQINSEKPGLWDVSHQIGLIETALQIANYMKAGNEAYQVERWDQVISSYEKALELDPKLDDAVMKEQLLNAYLKRIIGMLQNENASIADIENAELYHRRAVAMIPQNKAFASERGNLQEVSSSLLELKFTQTARAILEDKNQTTTSIAQAVSYLSKAANIQSNNTALLLDQKNAEYYQMAFRSFIDMDWASTISNLNQILAVDANYANGNAKILMYEAYVAQGKQYNSLSLYQDARKNLEQAEILAWDDTDNQMKLFQVQVLLGDTIGKMNDYENAVSYYKYALDAINFSQKVAKFPELSKKYSQATISLSSGRFEDAFTAFNEVMGGIDVVFSTSEMEIGDGACLAFFASENLSTVNAIIEANNMPKNMVVSFGRKLMVPRIVK